MSRIEPMSGSQPNMAANVWGEQLVEQLTGFEYEAREFTRTKLTTEIVVRATNGSGSVFGTPFKAVTTDISPGGMGFIHTTAVADKYLAITLGQNGSESVVLVEVVRSRAVHVLYEIGVKFIRLLDNPEA